MPNPYADFVAGYNSVRALAKALPLGGFARDPRPGLPPNSPKALLFAPHPDDECIVGALALRLLRELHVNVINVAVTQGSRKDRQAARFAELAQACDYLGFGLLATREGGLEKINPKGRAEHPADWAESVAIVAALLATHRPAVVFCPHDGDWNTTHIGTHLLVMDALARQPAGYACTVVETEFWQPLTAPNLMVESTAADLADLVAATSFHVGEVQRNPYHLGLPAWMQDNVRRGGELVGGQGAAVPDYGFATLYRLRVWRDGKLAAPYVGGRFVGAGESLKPLFPSL